MAGVAETEYIREREHFFSWKVLFEDIMSPVFLEKVWKCRMHVHFCRRSEDDQAAGEDLL